jgi:hypothetical protein
VLVHRFLLLLALLLLLLLLFCGQLVAAERGGQTSFLMSRMASLDAAAERERGPLLPPPSCTMK